jgi:hypothetical protein
VLAYIYYFGSLGLLFKFFHYGDFKDIFRAYVLVVIYYVVKLKLKGLKFLLR